VEKQILEKIPDSRLRAYVVWVPVLRAGPFESTARDESGRVADPRATQFLDPEGQLSKAYASVLHLPRYLPAWDVYFVFGPEAHWADGQGSDQPPTPTYWMHQLGRSAPAELTLNADQLARVVSGILSRPKQ